MGRKYIWNNISKRNMHFKLHRNCQKLQILIMIIAIWHHPFLVNMWNHQSLLLGLCICRGGGVRNVTPKQTPQMSHNDLNNLLHDHHCFKRFSFQISMSNISNQAGYNNDAHFTGRAIKICVSTYFTGCIPCAQEMYRHTCPTERSHWGNCHLEIVQIVVKQTIILGRHPT